MTRKVRLPPQSLANLRPVQKGEIRNPHGRPKGSRHKLAEVFLEELHKDFMEHGVQAICEVRENKPDQYLKVIAAIVPKEFTLHEGESSLERILDSVGDEELSDFIAGLRLLAVASSGGKEAAKKGTGNQLSEIH